MNEHNPPMALPNGLVYSQEAIQEIARQNGGKIVCPKTRDVFTMSQAKKMFVS